jgi:hypothetical protein
MRDVAGLRVFQHLDPFGTEGGCDGLADGRVFAEEQRAARQDRDLAPSRAKACASSSATTDEPITASRSGMVSLTRASVEVQ